MLSQLFLFLKNFQKITFLVKHPVWAAHRPWLRFWQAYISGTVSPIDKRSSLVGNPIPPAVYGTNAESCQSPLWHVARAAWRVSHMFRLLYLGNVWADFVEIWYALGNPLVTAYAVVTVRYLCTCARAEIPPYRASVTQKRLGRLCSNLVCGLGVIN